ncbi:diablo, IAP-binding mitochondrial protein a [Alosa pseudoharengus]|uniref:diablo, IAP-binding mitochondrial protein a n=1 Tax=Alosa pseudoharengus TaxID=34774 RepID=UPI003F886CCD
MQAARQSCSCLTGVIVQSRTNFLLSSSKMASLRRGLSYINFIRSTVCALGSNKLTRQQFLRLPETMRKNGVPFSVGSGLCSVPFTQQAEQLSHEALIRRASNLVTDSANTYLSQTTLALVDSLTQYAKTLHTLIALQRRYLASLGKMTPAEEDSIWQVIIGQRVEVGDRLDACNRFEINWINAINICEMAAEAAYTSGAEHASVTVKSHIQMAQAQVQESRQLTKDAERKLAEIKADEIQRMAEYANTRDINVEDMPEAYLRED